MKSEWEKTGNGQWDLEDKARIVFDKDKVFSGMSNWYRIFLHLLA